MSNGCSSGPRPIAIAIAGHTESRTRRHCLGEYVPIEKDENVSIMVHYCNHCYSHSRLVTASHSSRDSAQRGDNQESLAGLGKLAETPRVCKFHSRDATSDHHCFVAHSSGTLCLRLARHMPGYDLSRRRGDVSHLQEFLLYLLQLLHHLHGLGNCVQCLFSL